MKLIHINSYLDGSPFYKNLYQIQQKNGLDLSVYLPISYRKKKPNVLEDYVIFSRCYPQYYRMFFHLKHSCIWKDIQKKVDGARVDLVHAHSLFSNGYIAYLMKKTYGVPYMVAVRNTDVNVFFKYMMHLRPLGLRILREADAVIFISEPYKEAVMGKYIPEKYRNSLLSKSYVIPNGIDKIWLENRGSKELGADHKIRLVYTGVIDQNKNILTTVKACKLLIHKGIDVKFTVIGKCVDKRILNELEKESFVTYLPPKTQLELMNLYREQDIFIMPSKTETFGLVYAEAMSQGLPVIYSESQGFDQQFEEGAVGYHVPCMDYGVIAEKIELIMSHYKELSENCANLCQKFDWINIEKTYQTLYSDILFRHKRGEI